MADVLLDLIGEIYEASHRSGNWYKALEKLCSLVGAKSGGVFMEDYRSRSRVILAHYGFPRTFESLYRLGAGKYDYTFKAQLNQPVGTARQIIDHSEVKEDHPIYYRLIRQFDLGYICGINIYKNDEWHVGLALHRSFSGEPFGADELRILNLLYPHLKRAIRIQRELYRLHSRELSLRATLSKLTLGIIIIDPDQRAVYANPVAEAILEQHQGLKIRDGHLRAYYPEENARLTVAVSSLTAVAANDTEHHFVPLGLHHPDNKLPLNVTVASANEVTSQPISQSLTGNIALYLSNPESSINIPAEALQAIYQMTIAEAKVAIGLANGLNLRQIAAQNVVSLETVRTQLKSVFSKMGVNKQQDVIRLLLNGAIHITPAD